MTLSKKPMRRLVNREEREEEGKGRKEAGKEEGAKEEEEKAPLLR